VDASVNCLLVPSSEQGGPSIAKIRIEWQGAVMWLTARISQACPACTKQWVYRGSLNPSRHRASRPQWSLATGVEHMVQALQGETELVVTAEHARHTLEIILSSWESIRTGQAVELETTF
jgi:predicted dehydrogenase